MASEQQRSGRRSADLVVVRRRDLRRRWRTPGLVAGDPTAQWNAPGPVSGAVPGSTPGFVPGRPAAWRPPGRATGDGVPAWGSDGTADARRLVRGAAGTLGVDLRGRSGASGRTVPRVRRGAVHGAAGDPRYPSPRELRKVLSFGLDLVLHLAIGVGVAAALLRLGQPAVVGAVAGIAGFVVASAVHRIVVQRLTSATLGKAITGLRIIRDDTGGPATTGLLVMQWLFGVLLIVAGLFS
ncbi:RDD family protein [Actinocatenispora comari]|uniref:RDD domain-containing protein n=1 Tax=Actinocatenispora comari TaxID=2807577 RepID=A0A8J4EJU1_9ACTN|nr:RDD family protein [Actinocatenispora comari]GIL27502.1 hypothetical protein NUM_27560 [Actinocatenispora comari]